MIYSKNVLLIGGDSFKAKDGRQFHKVDLLDLNKTSGKAVASTQFVDNLPALIVEGKATFGDTVTARFEIADMTSKPKLVDITRVVKKSTLPSELGDEATN